MLTLFKMSTNRIFLSPPFLDGNERRYVNEAFDSNYVAPCGPMVDRFEHEFASCVGVPNACALSSATAAIDLLCDKLSIGNGDVVFCSDLTFIASIAPSIHRGAIPVFIDCDRNTWTMDPELLGKALADSAKCGMLPKAVIAVDLYGQCCDYSRIVPLCAEYEVPLVVDAAEALGARFRDKNGVWHAAGDVGYAAVYSFNGNKIITTSGGGMMVSRDKSVTDNARFLSQQARDPAPWYQHTRIGYNYRMSNITAAIGVGQLECLDAKVDRKREIFDKYSEKLLPSGCFEMMPEADYCRANRWLSVATVAENRNISPEQVRLALEAQNIESRPLWKPMHLQPVFQGVRTYGGKVSEDLFARGICLPSGAGMTDEDILRVIRVLTNLE